MHFKHCIIGAGPVGLVLAHLFKKFNMNYAIFESKQALQTHPSAHYLNMRTMEILDELNIKLPLEDREYFRNYVYLRRIGEQPIKVTDQYLDHRKYSLQSYAHLPQHLFVQTLAKVIQVNYGSTLVDFNETDKINLSIKQGDKIQEITCDYLYGCDGLNGFTRKHLGIKLQGREQIQSFLNVHFQSRQLMDQIQRYSSMLTFVYNANIIAVLIKHHVESGTFAIQIPLDLLTADPQNYSQLQQDHRRIRNLINSCTMNFNLQDIEIKSVGLWKMSAVIAEQYYKGRTILVGDSCHSMPPAGGFGMNTGIQDAYNLAYKIKSNGSLADYERERQIIARRNMDMAYRYYKVSLNIAKSLSLDYNNLKTFQNVVTNVPLLKPFYSNVVKLGASFLESDAFISRAKINDEIPLVFPNYELPPTLAPLSVRQRVQNMKRTWFAINCEIPKDLNHEFQKIEDINLPSMIVRDDLEMYI